MSAQRESAGITWEGELAPARSAETARCTHCSAPLVADQRYCLSCGQPCAPVRLAFLDVLESDRRAGGVAPIGAPVPYMPRAQPVAGPPWLRRYAPIFSVLAVLLMAMIIGLLVGHWVTQSKAPSRQVIKIEGLSAAPAAAAATPSTAAPAGSESAKASPASQKQEREEAAEARAEATKPVAPPKPVKVTEGTLKKLSTTTGRKHQEEINKLGTAPIAVP